MAEHRFYAGPDTPLHAGSETTLAGEQAHRIARVLRMQPGARLALFSEEREFECELVSLQPRVCVRLLEEVPAQSPQRELVLYQALIRPNRFEWLIEKLTELGVSAIVPLLSERTTVRPSEIGATRLERWRRIAVEAAEQCGRRRVPTIEAPVSFTAALTQARGCIVFAWEGMRGGETPAADNEGGPIALFVGPEGGWSAAEADHARAAGARFAGLGPNLLRAETAAIVAAALLLLADKRS
jgi:16S rRNA (uracil1498-N3)-methyltransferase